MKIVLPINEKGNVEISTERLEELLSDSYRDGYVQGQIDHVLNTSPDFAISENREEQKKKNLSDKGKPLMFRATIF